MKLRCHFLLFVVTTLLFGSVTVAADDNDDDDSAVEDIPDEKESIQVEKPKYVMPKVQGNTYFAEPFDSKEDFSRRWVLSEAKKDGADENIAKYDGKWSVEEPTDNLIQGDLGLVLKTKAKHHAVSAKLAKPFDFSGKPLIVQYDVRFQNGMDCGGAYIKLLSKKDGVHLDAFHDKTPYTIMFGPDKCGNDHKLHFIFRHKNPKTGEYEEKHAKKPSKGIDSYFSDKKTHLYTLIVNPDNTFEILVDQQVISQGSLLEDVSPPVNPPAEIEDPNDKKPSDWDEKEKIPDKDAKKPDDWDESEPEEIEDTSATKPEGWLDEEESLIPDPDAEKPVDWDDDMDGEWEAPLIENPKCKSGPGCGEWKLPKIKNPKFKGKWIAPMIDNPNYKGVWKPRKIPNPDFFEDLEPYKMTPIDAIGLELWSMSDGIIFDNFLVTDDRHVMSSWTAQTWEIKNDQEKASTSGKGIWQTLMKAAEERPWLWAIYVVVLLLPILLLSICLCPRSGPIKEEDLKTHHKKTDEDTPEDKVPDEKEEDLREEHVAKVEPHIGPGGDNSSKTKKSKAALEAEENMEGGTDEDEEEKLEVPDQDEKEEEEEESPKASPESSPRKSPRRRKPRKD
ncbi:hypothetical protein ACJMK2_030717 [Sinanodonta woodiana]|uniref:Calnexin n=1 Tax=Sinanodonta woodiana TaxID=1069815 RepID=A0ABD3WXW2_SINWO